MLGKKFGKAPKPAGPRLEPARWSPLSWTTIGFGAALTFSIAAVLCVVGIDPCVSLFGLGNNAADKLDRVGGLGNVWFFVATAFILFMGGLVASALSEASGNQCAARSGFIVWAVASLIVLAAFISALR